MTWTEFQMLLSNIPSNTPLFEMISLRQTDDEGLKDLSEKQREVRDNWIDFIHGKIDNHEIVSDFSGLQNALQSAFGKGG